MKWSKNIPNFWRFDQLLIIFQTYTTHNFRVVWFWKINKSYMLPRSSTRILNSCVKLYYSVLSWILLYAYINIYIHIPVTYIWAEGTMQLQRAVKSWHRNNHDKVSSGRMKVRSINFNIYYIFVFIICVHVSRTSALYNYACIIHMSFFPITDMQTPKKCSYNFWVRFRTF